MKTFKRITLLMAIVSFVAFQGFSQTTPGSNTVKGSQVGQTTANPTAGKFVDANKDGVCDNHQAKMASGKCTRFVDKDGNGKCDNCKGTGNCKSGLNGCGTGCQHRQGQGTGNCASTGCGKQLRHGCGQGNAPASGQQGSNEKK